MALKKNLDIEFEQVDQTVADLSVLLTEGGGLPRAINYMVADTPAGEAGVAVPLLSFSSPGLSPLNVEPIASTVSSSYDTSRVLDGTLVIPEFEPVLGWNACARFRCIAAGPV